MVGFGQALERNHGWVLYMISLRSCMQKSQGLKLFIGWSVGFSAERFGKGGNKFSRVICATKVVVVVVLVLINHFNQHNYK